MDQEPAMWIKKEGTAEVKTELYFMAQVYPHNMNIKEELEEGVNEESIEDPLGISWSTDFIKEDPELNLEMSVTENIVETSTGYASDSTRLTQCAGGCCDIPCEETSRHRVVQDELVIDMKSTHEFGTNTKDMTVDKNCSVATQYNCSTREKELYVYSCNFCQQSFPSKYRFIKHVFMHIDGVQPPSYVCKWCGEVFHSNVSLKKHLRMSENHHVLTAGNHEKYGYSEEHQSSIFSDSEPEVSIAEYNELNSYKEMWKAASDIGNTHMTNDTEETNHYGSLSTTVNVRSQGDLLTANRIHKRDICGKSFAGAGNLKKHGLIHTRKKPHKCKICGKSFAFPSHLKKHMVLHTGKKPHKCELCGQSFPRRSSLNRHKLIHTGNKSHKCQICGKYFARTDALRSHSLIHTGKKSNKCEICGKSFARTSNLKAHKLIHTGKKPHKCEICGKSIAYSSSLKKHLLLHTGKKPHKCEICGKSFAFSWELKTHVFPHTGKKPHKCEICGKSFAFSNGLKKHVLLHTGKKPHKCEICDKSFALTRYLKKHVLIHTEKKPHKCEIRGRSFARAGNLKTLNHTCQEETSQK
ncbi:zinc finger protein 708-like isoform X2 [Schistocerca serialis cubense]|uniref:zinc finger protein 708-like isoform X2 n=1 Tax=Schistocerca serialis cubense TaxID=2023355 RepID=UPI00214E0D9D|nr:zinc finger protein 708-like isoform X2 [Schistocerca serialis cubense]